MAVRSDAKEIEDYEKNLRAIYSFATFKDEIEGDEWYTNAKEECRKISRESGFSLKRVVWAMAVLSNNKSWEENVSLTRSVCFQLSKGMKATGHFQTLIDKATDILVNGNFNALSGPKVIPFAQAIYQPQSNAAVIDRWMWRAANEGHDYSPWLSPARLNRVAIALRRVARKANLPATTAQAIIWTTIRRMYADR